MADLNKRVLELKKERDAIILVHNYQRPEVQDVADYTGDSLGLSMQATKTDAKNIIFCGVDFMAESAFILNRNKRVVLPDPNAKCPMAAMITVEGLREVRKENPDAVTVAYVNTHASVKAEVDVCCTSSNAVKVIKSLEEKKVIFVPDTNLGLYVQRFVPDKELIFWPGYCPTHQNITKEAIMELKAKHSNARIVVHPECIPEVIDAADAVKSTEGIVKYVASSPDKEFIIGTEKELTYRLKKENPGKLFYSLEKAICPNMKKITLEKVVNALENLEPKICVPEDIAERARIPLQRMMKIGRGD